MIDPIGLVGESSAALMPKPGMQAENTQHVDFGQWLGQEIRDVNQQVLEGDTQIRNLALGQSDNLHQVMISLAKAKTSFELIVQVRNKILEAYQDVMRMQI